MDNSFPKSEKLYGKYAVEQLYKEGNRFVVWPLRITYVEAPDGENRVLVWAPKSLFKHAVNRNRLRRQMREAYRLNKHILAPSMKRYHLSFNYLDKNMHAYASIEKATRKALTKIYHLSDEKMV